MRNDTRVFPTLVGVFPAPAPAPPHAIRLPHARGVFLTSTKKILPPTFFLRIRGDGCQKDPPGMGLPVTAGCIRLKAVPSFPGARR